MELRITFAEAEEMASTGHLTSAVHDKVRRMVGSEYTRRIEDTLRVAVRMKNKDLGYQVGREALQEASDRGLILTGQHAIAFVERFYDRIHNDQPHS